MFDSMWLLPLLGEAEGGGGGGAAQPGPGGGLTALLFPMAAIAVFWYFLLLRPQKREQAKRDNLLKELKKNDRVVTIGGIIGTVANLTPDGKEVTLKVDDNTRLRMLRSSIQTVLRDESEGEAAKA
jgi:preprotein translocase subunit YajC